MKKTILKIAAVATVAAALFMAVACGGEETSTGGTSDSGTHTVTFDYNYDGAPDAYTVEVEDGNAVDPPEDPERENYEFTDWYNEAACTSLADFEYAITSDVTYYAGWTLTGAVITFNVNYDGGESFTAVATIGGTVTMPDSPTRDGYLFGGWYTDADCTEAYDFSAEVTGDLELYAYWIEDDGSTVALTYMWNYDGAGVYTTVYVTYNKKTTEQSISRDGYRFCGWYTDADCTDGNEYDFSSRVTESATLYAKWFTIYTFEAEYTDVDDLQGMGYSGNANGTNMIVKDQLNGGASNGYYVGWLYSEGLTLTFNVTSDEDVDDAYLVLRLSAEYYSISLTDDEFLVSVNGEKASFDELSFDVSSATTTQMLAFGDYECTTRVSLNAGDNVITLRVNNDTYLSGTMYAKAPLVDCIYVETGAGMDWAEGFPKTSNIA